MSLPSLISRKRVSLWLALIGLGLIAAGQWIPLKAQLAQILLERAWTQTLATGTKQKAWSWADTHPTAKLSIPALGLESIILSDAGGEGLAFGPILLNQSAKPHEAGTTIISAHRDTHFKSLANLRQGMTIQLQDQTGQTRLYQVDSMRIAPWNKSGLTKQSDEKRLALTSCWPFDSDVPGPLRFIAEATPITQTAQAN